VIAVPVQEGVPVPAYLLCRYPDLAGDVLEAVAALVRLDNCPAQLRSSTGTQQQSIGFRLLVRLAGFQDFRHV
jgi:hypothetical protein